MMRLKRFQQQPFAVDLPEDEFRDIYAELRDCLEREIQPDLPEGGEAAFLQACWQKIAQRAPEKAQDLEHGFLPLFERLQKARARPLRGASGLYYRVRFQA